MDIKLAFSIKISTCILIICLLSSCNSGTVNIRGEQKLIDILNDKRIELIKEPLINTIFERKEEISYFRMWMWEPHTSEDYCTVVRFQKIQDEYYLVTKKLDGDRMIFPVKSKIVSNDSMLLNKSDIDEIVSFVDAINFEREPITQDEGYFDCVIFYLEIYRCRDGNSEFLLIDRCSQENICFKLKDLIHSLKSERLEKLE